MATETTVGRITFSPGPWRPNDILPHLIQCADGLVASTATAPDNPGRDAANARLIAAAPDLLAALKAIAAANAKKSVEAIVAAMPAVHAAIDRAEGRDA